MQDSEFIKMITKTSTRMGIIGFFILLFGAFMGWLFVSGIDPDAQKMSTGGKVTGWIFAGLFMGVGILMLFVSVKSAMKIKNGNHPLVNSINNNDPSYILWYYEHVTHVRSGPASNTAHNIWLMGADKKQYTLNVKKKNVDSVFAYLGSKYPNALVGYSKELETAYNERLKALGR